MRKEHRHWHISRARRPNTRLHLAPLPALRSPTWEAFMGSSFRAGFEDMEDWDKGWTALGASVLRICLGCQGAGEGAVNPNWGCRSQPRRGEASVKW